MEISNTPFDLEYKHRSEFPRDAWVAISREWRKHAPNETYALIDSGAVDSNGHEVVTLFLNDLGLNIFKKLLHE